MLKKKKLELGFILIFSSSLFCNYAGLCEELDRNSRAETVISNSQSKSEAQTTDKVNKWNWKSSPNLHNSPNYVETNRKNNNSFFLNSSLEKQNEIADGELNLDEVLKFASKYGPTFYTLFSKTKDKVSNYFFSSSSSVSSSSSDSEFSARQGGGDVNRAGVIDWLARLIGVQGKTLGEFLREYQVHVLYDLLFIFFKWIFFLYAGLLIP